MLDFYTIQKPKARKDYMCDICGCKITKGETYQRYGGKYDGYMFDYKYCLPCAAFAEAYCREAENEYDEDAITEWLAEKECSVCPCGTAIDDESNELWDTCNTTPLRCTKLREKYYKPSACITHEKPRFEVEIMCSRCGKRAKFKYSPQNAKKRTDEGWNSFGDAIYCPECSATWEERNGTDRPQWGAKHTQKKIKEIFDSQWRAHDDV